METQTTCIVGLCIVTDKSGLGLGHTHCSFGLVQQNQNTHSLVLSMINPTEFVRYEPSGNSIDINSHTSEFKLSAENEKCAEFCNNVCMTWFWLANLVQQTLA